jgi:hypothetical protein
MLLSAMKSRSSISPKAALGNDGSKTRTKQGYSDSSPLEAIRLPMTMVNTGTRLAASMIMWFSVSQYFLFVFTIGGAL